MNEDDLPDEPQEELEDLKDTGKQYSAVINQADWTVQTIIQQIVKGNIELNPSFQRREAWRPERKSQYIESLLINVPVPQIVLAERPEKRGRFIVIDGKQRLMTLRQFFADVNDPEFRSFKLQNLTVRAELNGLNLSVLKHLYPSDVDILENSTIRTAVIRNWVGENFLYSVFLRLNTGSVPLSPQELRQALHPGPFATFVNEYSMTSEILHQAMHISKPDVRMRDAELVIRFFAFRNFIEEYGGDLKGILDTTTEYFNENWKTTADTITSQQVLFEAAIYTTIEIFTAKNAFRKWNGRSYEFSLNRAIFDVMMFYFVEPEIAFLAGEKKEDVQTAFKRICTDAKFRSAVEGTTKSIEALHTRLSMWGEALASVLDHKILVPKLKDNRITR